jgi:fumarylacetoacetase
VTTSAFRDHVFGFVLVNDWSARDIQAWEYQPLGPFLGKSFATSISPWVVPLEELAGFRVPLPPQEPPPLDYLAADPWAYDLELEIELNSATISRTSARHLYWSVEQQVAHLTANGASLRTGDLLASGTISGPDEDSRGSLIELTWNKSFLADGDEVVLRAPELELEVRGRITA